MNTELRLARKLCSKSKHLYAFHAALVIRGGAVLSAKFNSGWNHAEQAALQDLWPDQRPGTRLWSIRFNKSGALANAKPCANCEAFARANGVKVIFYSTPDGVERMKL